MFKVILQVSLYREVNLLGIGVKSILKTLTEILIVSKGRYMTYGMAAASIGLDSRALLRFTSATGS
jgi:hypothetical protein